MLRRAYDPAPCGDVLSNSSRSSRTWEEGFEGQFGGGPEPVGAVVPSPRGRSRDPRPERGAGRRRPAGPGLIGARMRGRFLRIAAAVVAGVALGLSLSVLQAGGWESWLAHRGDRSRVRRPGTGRSIAGRAPSLPRLPGLRLPDRRPRGRDGLRRPLLGDVFPALADTTRTCAYSRANRWGSDARATHTVAQSTADLRAALASAGERPPFVLVGHSLGDVYVRVFAGLHPDEVSGLVLVDPFGPDRFRRLIALASPNLARAWQADLDGNIAGVHGNRAAGLARVGGRASGGGSRRPARRGGDRPPAVRGRSAHPRRRARRPGEGVARRDRRISGRVRLTLAPGSSHMIQWDRPELVIAAVKRLVEGVRGG